MNLKCMVGMHEWGGCKCIKCKKTRDQGHDWTEDWRKCGQCGAPSDELLLLEGRLVRQGTPSSQVTRKFGKCPSITTMDDVLGVAGGAMVFGDRNSSEWRTQLWVYEFPFGKLSLDVLDGIVKDVRFESKRTAS